MLENKELKNEELENVFGGKFEKLALEWYEKNYSKIIEQIDEEKEGWSLVSKLFELGLDDNKLYTIDDIKNVLIQHGIDISNFED